MTYRLMAEWATDLVCKKLAVNKSCVTMDVPLPGSELENIDLNIASKFCKIRCTLTEISGMNQHHILRTASSTHTVHICSLFDHTALAHVLA